MIAAFRHPSERSPSDHDRDIHAWARWQEAALLEGRSADLDLPNLALEIAALGRSEYRALESALLRLLQHLLKWDHQADGRCRSWYFTIKVQREAVDGVLRDNPSLRGRRSDAMQVAFRRGRAAMLRETALPEAAFPEINPYCWDELLGRNPDPSRHLARALSATACPTPPETP